MANLLSKVCNKERGVEAEAKKESLLTKAYNPLIGKEYF